MNLDLNGKNALVCGGSKGLGKAAAIALSELGANITLVARNPIRLGETVEELTNSIPQKHSFLVADFTNPKDLQKKVKGLTLQHNFQILINNTGGPAAGMITEADSNAFLNAFNQHLICNQILSQLLIPGMKAANYGRIINIISTSVKAPINGLGVSNTIRGAVANWAKTLSNELAAEGITVNNVLPGSTSTERLDELIASNASKYNLSIEETTKQMQEKLPIKRFGRPEEIGAAIAFLASPSASYITGINLPVDGGKTPSL